MQNSRKQFNLTFKLSRKKTNKHNKKLLDDNV